MNSNTGWMDNQHRVVTFLGDGHKSKLYMFWKKDELKEIPFNFLHDAIHCINLRLPVLSVYMDRKGGVAVEIDKDLEPHEIQDCLFDLHYFGPYSAAPEGPSVENPCLGLNFDWNRDGKTIIYSSEGTDYRQF